MSDTTKLIAGLIVLILGAGVLGYALGANGAPDEADAAAARAEAQTQATEAARDEAYKAGLAEGKAAGEAEGAKAGRAEGGTDGFEAADAELAEERERRQRAQGDCLPFQAFVPGVGCFPPLVPDDVDPGAVNPEDGPGNSENAPGHEDD